MIRRELGARRCLLIAAVVRMTDRRPFARLVAVPFRSTVARAVRYPLPRRRAARGRRSAPSGASPTTTTTIPCVRRATAGESRPADRPVGRSQCVARVLGARRSWSAVRRRRRRVQGTHQYTHPRPRATTPFARPQPFFFFKFFLMIHFLSYFPSLSRHLLHPGRGVDKSYV